MRAHITQGHRGGTPFGCLCGGCPDCLRAQGIDPEAEAREQAHEEAVANERARIGAAVLAPRGRALTASGYEHPATVAILDEVTSSRDDAPAMQAFEALFRAIESGAADQETAELARCAYRFAVDLAARQSVDCPSVLGNPWTTWEAR